MMHVVFYAPGEDVATKAPLHFPAHKARLDEFHARGVLRLVGAFEDPVRDGSMAVFTTREAADEFVAGDPFVLEGVVASVEIRGWNEVLDLIASRALSRPARPRRSQPGRSGGPWTTAAPAAPGAREDLVGPVAQDRGGLRLDALGVVAVHRPARSSASSASTWQYMTESARLS